MKNYLIILFLLVGCNASNNVNKLNVDKTVESGNSKKETVSEVPAIDTRWGKATFQGLQIGVDSRGKALGLFGKPSSSVEPEDQDKADPVIWDEYKNGNEFYESFTIVSTKKKKLVISVFAYPRDPTLEKLVSFFGESYQKTKYDFFECPGDAGSSKIVESPTGQLEYLEYRAKGIAIHVNQGKAEDIGFLSRPNGLQEPKCQ